MTAAATYNQISPSNPIRASTNKLQSGSLLNVDFEYFDPNPTIDFHGLKALLRQLFDADNQLFDLSELADMILAQPMLGSTIKCEGMESDPYAFLSVLNLRTHAAKPVIQALTTYLAAAGTAEIRGTLADEKAQVGLLLTERFINMPHQVVPPMYAMLQEEIAWANEEKEPYEFTHYLVVSKTYTEVASKLDEEDDRPQKKTKKVAAAAEDFYFHPEDEVLKKVAVASCGFDYQKQGEEGASDSKRAFQELGVKPRGLMMLVEAGKFGEAVKAVKEYVGAEAEGVPVTV